MNEICPRCGGFRQSPINGCWHPFHFNFPAVNEYNRLRMEERRERIATAAMQGFSACPHCCTIIRSESTRGDGHAARLVARSAVEFADALIAELDK